MEHPFYYLSRKIKKYKSRRDSYKPDSKKWYKYDMLLKWAEYKLSEYVYSCKLN